MSDLTATPWLSIIGIGEDGLAGLPDASKDALARAEIVFGGPRHLALAGVGARGHEWPLPFSVAPVLALAGRPVAVLASGDPFWHGVGTTLARALPPGSWRAFPAPSCISLAAVRLGWALEETICLGLHAAPLARMRRHLGEGARILCTLRNGEAVGALAGWLCAQGFGASDLHICEALSGPRERVRMAPAEGFTLTDIAHPVVVGITSRGVGLPRTPGLADDLFQHDGQITKRAVRALTLSALAPRPGEVLWDIGAGSGSVSIEWLLAAPRSHSVAIERDATRADRILANAANFGVEHRLSLIQGGALEALADLAPPDAVFIGGGATEALMAQLWATLAPGTRLVANAVTLESEALFTAWSAQKGGSLTRIALSQAEPLGRRRGWQAARPVVQWSVTL